MSGVVSPSLLVAGVQPRLWQELSRRFPARKYSKCSDFIPPDVLALGTARAVPSRDGGQGTQFCVPYTRLLPPPLARAGGASHARCMPSGL